MQTPTKAYPWWRVTVAYGCGVNYRHTCRTVREISAGKSIEFRTGRVIPGRPNFAERLSRAIRAFRQVVTL